MTDIASISAPTTTAALLAAPAPRARRPFGRWFRETGWRHLIGIVMLVFAGFLLRSRIRVVEVRPYARADAQGLFAIVE